MALTFNPLKWSHRSLMVSSYGTAGVSIPKLPIQCHHAHAGACSNTWKGYRAGIPVPETKTQLSLGKIRYNLDSSCCST